MDHGLRRKRRNLVVLCILLSIPVYANVHQLLTQRRFFLASSAPYDLPAITRETQAFKKLLRPQPVTGYFSDSGSPADVEYLKLQYAFAPDLLQPLARTDYAVARFFDPVRTTAFLQREHYRIIRTNPDGVTLLQLVK